MSNRIHVMTRCVIEYGEEGFNWQIDQLRNLLHYNGCCISGTLNDDSIGDWEIEEGEFLNAVKNISGMSAESIVEYFDKDFVGEDTPEVFKKKVVSILETFAETGDHECGYYHFTWF